MKLAATLCAIILALPLWAGQAVILAVTDSHCQVDNLRRLAGLIGEERRKTPDALLVDNGDTIQGTFYGADNSMIGVRILNALDFDLWSPGNHDFELHPQAFAAFKGTVLGANWRTAAFTPVPWTMIRRGKCRIAIIGLTEDNLDLRHLPSENIQLFRMKSSLEKIMPEIRRAEANLIVLMSHNGTFSRKNALPLMLRSFPEIRLVIGGHTHDKVDGAKIGRAWFVQPGKHGEYLGKITVDFDDSTGKVRQIHSELIPVTPDTPAAEFPGSIEKDLKRITKLKHTRAGKILQPLNPGRIMAGTAKAQCAIYSGNPFLLTGSVTHGDIFRLMPYENRICSLRLTPEELRQIVQEECRLLAKYRKRRYTVFYGMAVKFDREGRLTHFAHPAPGADGKITAAFCDYYLAGSGGYTAFVRGMLKDRKTDHTGILLRNAVYRYMTE